MGSHTGKKKKKIMDFGGARGLWLDLSGNKIDHKTAFTTLKGARHRDVILSNNVRIISRSLVISPISHAGIKHLIPVE